MARPLLLVDTAGLYFRAFYAIPESAARATDGTPVNAVRGFVDMLATLIRTRRPDRLTCALDTEHSHHPYGAGLTAVVLPQGVPLTRTAIYEALIERRTYATSGPLLPVSVRYSTVGAQVGTLGSDLQFPSYQPLDVRLDSDPAGDADSHDPRVVATADRAVVVWVDHRAGSGTVGDIYARYVE